MLKRFLNHQSKNITSAAVILSVAYLLSRLLGLFRDRLLAGAFGAGDELDIYYAAFRIPDLVYSLLVMGVISAGFIPVFMAYKQGSGVGNQGVGIEDQESGGGGQESKAGSGKPKADDNSPIWYLTNALLNLMVVTMLIVCGLLVIFSPWIISLITPGFSPEKISLTVKLTRIMFLSPFFLGLSAVFGGILQSFKHFFVYSLGPIMYNLGIIFGILFLVKPFGLIGLAWGVVLGSFLHMLIQLPSTILCGWHYQWIFDLTHQGIQRILKLMPARTLSLAVSQINFLVMTIIASTLSAGSLAVYNLAYNIYAFPLGIFGVSLAIAAFPHLSEYAAKKNWFDFVKNFSSTCRQILFLTIPAAVLFIVLSQHLVKVILGTGKFNQEDITWTWQTLQWFALGVFAESLVLLLIRAFFALENTLIPFLIGVIGVGVRLSAALVLSRYLEVSGLALGYSLGSFIYLILLWMFLRKKIIGLAAGKVTGLDEKNIFITGFKIAIASLLAGLVSYFIIVFKILAISVFLQGLLAGLSALLVYFLFVFLFRLPEVFIFCSIFKGFLVGRQERNKIL